MYTYSHSAREGPDTATGNKMKKMGKLDVRVIPEISLGEDRETDRQTDTLITILRTPNRRGINSCINWKLSI